MYLSDTYKRIQQRLNWIDRDWVLLIGQASSRASCICRIHIEITEGHTWIVTDLGEHVGVRHLLHLDSFFPKWIFCRYCRLNKIRHSFSEFFTKISRQSIKQFLSILGKLKVLQSPFLKTYRLFIMIDASHKTTRNWQWGEGCSANLERILKKDDSSYPPPSTPSTRQKRGVFLII